MKNVRGLILIMAFLVLGCNSPLEGPNDEPAIPFTEVGVESGSFWMGAEQNGDRGEGICFVTVSSIYAGVSEVTNAQFRTEVGYLPANTLGGPNSPVTGIIISDAVTYANAKSIHEGLTPVYIKTETGLTVDWTANGWRLPTEAEWEFMARGGNKGLESYTRFSGSDNPDLVASSYGGDSKSIPRTIGRKMKNALGLVDLSSNSAELCWDWYSAITISAKIDPTGPASGTGRVVRGGHVRSQLSEIRVTARSSENAYGVIKELIGFRVVRAAF
jgi:formylglycine-generating enzyme required for sulfatase activity